MYDRFKIEAAATGEPARLTKINNIDSKAKELILAKSGSRIYPTYAEMLARSKQLLSVLDDGEFLVIKGCGEIRRYGRDRCREMVNRPLPFVTNYNPNTDPDWP